MIGRFSALSVSDTVYITSTCEGIETKYLMYRDGITIKIDEIHSKPTTNRNGLEILAYIKTSGQEETGNKLSQFADAVRSLVYFDKVYINNSLPDVRYGDGSLYSYRCGVDDCKLDTKEFNERIKQDHKTFVSSEFGPHGIYILLGDVLYPIDNGVIKNKLLDNNRYLNMNVAIKFNIGDLSITPNREGILYDGATIKKIKERLDAFEDELASMAKQDLNTDNFCKDTLKRSTFHDIIFNSTTAVTVYHDSNNTGTVDIANEKYRDDVLIDGHKLNNKVWQLLARLTQDVDLFTCKYKTSHYKTFKDDGYCSLYTVMYRTGKFFIKDYTKMKAYMRTWILDEMQNINVYILSFCDDWETNALNILNRLGADDADKKLAFAIYAKLVAAFKKNVSRLNESMVPEEYLPKDDEVKVRVKTDRIRITRWDGDYTTAQNSTIDSYLSPSTLYYYPTNDAEVALMAALSSDAIDRSLFNTDSNTYSAVEFISTALSKIDLFEGIANAHPVTELLTSNIQWANYLITCGDYVNKFTKDYPEMAYYPCKTYLMPQLNNTLYESYKNKILTLKKIKTGYYHFTDLQKLAKNIGGKYSKTIENQIAFTKDEIILMACCQEEQLTPGELLYYIATGKTVGEAATKRINLLKSLSI